jgi:4-hydroxy-3-methylbut-2-enyl diphosphate reductase
MQIVLSRYAGACYGVQRALALVEEAATGSCPVNTLGQLIHNPQVVAALEARGIWAVADIADAHDGALVSRSHGVAPEVIAAARARGLEIVDATCPHVSAAQQAARELREQGYMVVVVGEQGHPEVEAIRSWAGEGTLVVQNADDLDSAWLDASERVGLVVQTTQSPAALAAIVDALHGRGIVPEVRNTICSATLKRQQAAAELAASTDVMLVVGGRNSGNTTRLSEICSAVCPATYHIESPEEIVPAWFRGVEKVGITAGASTPETQIAAVVARLKTLA